jgi:O-antigen/teichoic acid export membrane protein
LSATANKSGDDIAALAKGGRTNVAGFFMRLIARIPFLFIAGQWYGPEALGRMAYAVIVIEFVAQVSTLGLKRGLALHLSGEGREFGAWDALLITFVATLIPTAILMMFPILMFPNSEVNGLDLLLPLIIAPIALTDIVLAALAYRFDISASVRARAIVEPWAISIGVFILSWYTLRDGLLISYALSAIAAFLTALVPFLKSYGLPRGWRPNAARLWSLTKHNVPLAAADVTEWMSRHIDLAILGLFVSPTTVGIYYVCQQVATLPQKLKTSFDPILGPVITRKLEEGDKAAVARQISQVGFWIIAAQAGVALTLAIPAEAIMGLVGPASIFVGGTGALVFLLFAEVAAATAVVSESALVYVARHRNFMISLAMLAVQIALSFGFLIAMREAGWSELYQAAAPAIALTLALALGSIAKVKLAEHMLGATVSVWRWPLIAASAAAVLVGTVATRGPEWSELIFGVPAILAAYAVIIWRYGFGEDDRVLFRKSAV